MKGIKMILGALAAASLLFSVNGYAQENANRDENGKIVRGAYETNKALDNTFISLGVGYNSGLNFGNGGTIPLAQAWGGLGIDAAIGKWWTPIIGNRINYHGFNNDINGNGFGSFRQHFLTVDILWSLIDTFWGYKETRPWDLVPYLSGGYARVKGNNEWIMGVGLLNKFYISDRIDILLDLRSMISKNAGVYDAPTGRDQIARTFGKFELPISATIGIGINLGKTGFNRHSSITPVVIPVPFTTEQYNALADKVAALEKENAALKDKIAALEKELAPYKNLVNGQTYLYQNGTFTAVDVKAGAPVSVYFDLGSSKLSAREKAHLEYFANNLVNADTKLSINGYADKQTGSAKINQTLSEQRVKTVVDLLKKAGASEENIECAAHGATVQPFDTAAKNRVVTIEVK